MSEEKPKKRKSSSLLISLPAILTACAALIVAIGGLGGLITVLASLRPTPTSAPMPVATTPFSNENVDSSLPTSIPTFPETEVPTDLPTYTPTITPTLTNVPTVTSTLTGIPTIQPIPQFVDLLICDVDIVETAVSLCNLGTKPALLNQVTIAWSPSDYDKPGWDSTMRITREPILPAGGKVIIQLFNRLDTGTRFMVDVNNQIEEGDENNNCVNADATVIPCP